MASQRHRGTTPDQRSGCEPTDALLLQREMGDAEEPSCPLSLPVREERTSGYLRRRPPDCVSLQAPRSDVRLRGRVAPGNRLFRRSPALIPHADRPSAGGRQSPPFSHSSPSRYPRREGLVAGLPSRQSVRSGLTGEQLSVHLPLRQRFERAGPEGPPRQQKGNGMCATRRGSWLSPGSPVRALAFSKRYVCLLSPLESARQLAWRALFSPRLLAIGAAS